MVTSRRKRLGRDEPGCVVARASRLCESCTRHTGETPVPLPFEKFVRRRGGCGDHLPLDAPSLTSITARRYRVSGGLPSSVTATMTWKLLPPASSGTCAEATEVPA